MHTVALFDLDNDAEWHHRGAPSCSADNKLLCDTFIIVVLQMVEEYKFWNLNTDFHATLKTTTWELTAPICV